jgi:predicted GNAT family acetyltransferase
MSVRVEDAPERERFEIYDGDHLAGFTQYRMNGDLMAFMHTEIEPAFEGRGMASQLIRSALEDARSRGLEVLPFCPFVNGYIQRHQEWADVIPPAYRKGFAAAAS